MLIEAGFAWKERRERQTPGAAQTSSSPAPCRTVVPVASWPVKFDIETECVAVA
jgi:hypothetical protein